MPSKLRSPNKLMCVRAVAQLFLATAGLAQTASTPAPIWSGEDAIPQQYGDRKVFLYPDEHSVILLWPNPDGTGSKPRRLPLHNVIFPELNVRIESDSALLVYRYELKNTKQSQDSITTFSIVIYPDPNLQAEGEVWRAMKSTAIVGKRVGIPEAPDGGLVLWSSPDTQPLLPNTSTQFKLRTQATPGFTTAATEHFPHLDTSDEWPQQILDELDPVLDPHWIDQHIITLGPRYAQDEPASRIASDYIVGIQELIRQRRIEPTSPLAQDMMSYLKNVSQGASPAPLTFSANPHSDLEAEILSALQLALHVSNQPK